jgi:serine/threonine-protein kinase
MDLRAQLQATLGDAYRIGRELGGGGMSRVFMAEELALQRQVVIKVLPPELAASVSIARFHREILLAARLQHPNIVPVLAAGDVDGLPYYTMPYVEGESLRQRIARDGALAPAEGFRILRDVAAALAHAHERGIIHRDVKPGNVLLAGSAAMVADFGVAKALWVSSGERERSVTRVGDSIGTPAYMAPEQLDAPERVDERADIYSLGAVAYEVFVGRPPERHRPSAPAAAGAEGPASLGAARAGVPAAVAGLVERALDADPARRPQQAAEIVRALDELTSPSHDTPAARTADGAGLRPPPAPPRLRPALVATVIAALGITAAIYFAPLPRRARGETAADAMPHAALRPMSIAVLPFVNESGDANDEYFVDGITDDLTSALGKFKGLHVVGRSSAFAFKGKAMTARTVGDSLGVAMVLEGTARRASANWRVNASLVDVATGESLWFLTFDPAVKNVFQVQDDITRRIAQQLKVSLGSGVSVAGTSNLEALDLYFKARYHGLKFTRTDLQRAMEFLKSAVRIDSTYATAWAGIAGIWGLLADDWVAPSEAHPKAKAAALRALRIDSTLGAAHAVLGAELMWHDWDADSAARELARAVRFDPNNSETYAYRGILYLYQQRPDSALAQARLGQAIDKFSAQMAILACDAYQDSHDLPSAERECRRALDIDPSSAEAALELATLLGRSGRYTEAAEFAARGSNVPSRQAVVNAHLQISQGHPDSARKLLGRIEADARARREYVRPDPVGAAYLRLGEVQTGLVWYERAFKERSASLMGYGTGSARERAFAPPDSAVLADPRVRAFANKVRLARRGLQG